MSNRTKHKRKYIKKSKKFYGGIGNYSSFAQQQALNQLPSSYKDLTKNPMVSKMGSKYRDNYEKERNPNSSPTLISNLELILKLIALKGNQLADSFIQNVAKNLNLDINQGSEEIINQITGKVRGLIDILKSEQGEKMIAEITDLFNEGLSIFKPIVFQTLEEFNVALKKELKLLFRIANEAATELPPVFLIEEISNLISTFIIFLTSVAKIFPAVAEGLEKIESFKQKVSNMQGNFNQLVNQDLSNKLISSNNSLPAPKSIISQNMNSVNGGALMKKLMKERKMIGGNIEKSRANFLNPNLILSQLIMPHKNKSRKRF
jgi:hypothetical protein